jgi:hypothetical protein
MGSFMMSTPGIATDSLLPRAAYEASMGQRLTRDRPGWREAAFRQARRHSRLASIGIVRMKVLFASIVLNLAVAAGASAAEVKPFHAEYATLRNGDEVGRTTLDLGDNGDGSWSLRSETKGTSGLARLAGIHIVETSRFRWKDGRPEAVAYDYTQEGAFKQRTRHADFDWKTNEVRVSEGGQDYRYPIVAGIIDRQAVTLAIASDLVHGASAHDYPVAVKDRVEPMRYVRGALETLKVPAGEFKAQLMQRDGEPGADRKRVARSWFAESLGWLPVQIEQTEKKGDTVTLKLVSVRHD